MLTSKLIAEAEKNGINIHTLRGRLWRNWDVEEAVTRPARRGAQEKQYAVYKGDELLAMGTSRECAEVLGCDWKTIQYYTTPAYQRKLAKRKTSGNHRTVIKLDD